MINDLWRSQTLHDDELPAGRLGGGMYAPCSNFKSTCRCKSDAQSQKVELRDMGKERPITGLDPWQAC